MKSRSSFSLIMMLAALVLSLIPAATITARPALALSTCDAAQFVTDVTVPDNSLINAGATFVKTWRLKNTGVCQWTTGYTLVFASGEKMGGPDSVAFPKAVLPGQTVDLTVTLTAPNASGTFRGNWQLKNASGGLFGIGTSHSNPFWVQIKVTLPTQNVTAYDFVDNMCSAQWSYGGGPIPCPLNTNKLLFGYVKAIDNPVMENGTTSPIHGLLTIPQSQYNGLIRGSFPVTDIFRGDRFQASIGCQFNAVNCYVTYELEYQTGDSLFTLWKSKEKYDGLVTQADVDLTKIAGLKNARLVLTILSTGPYEGDQPLWVAPRIVRAAAAPVTTPTPIPPTSVAPTVAPTSALGCDRAQFISDMNVPDGTVFTPNAPFTKTWRLKNVGTCTWTTAYSLVLASGDRMGGADTLIPLTVSPGQIVDLSINLTAPNLAGSYRGYWQFKNASGGLFGIGADGNQPFFVDIKVSGTASATLDSYNCAGHIHTDSNRYQLDNRQLEHVPECQVRLLLQVPARVFGFQPVGYRRAPGPACYGRHEPAAKNPGCECGGRCEPVQEPRDQPDRYFRECHFQRHSVPEGDMVFRGRRPYGRLCRVLYGKRYCLHQPDFSAVVGQPGSPGDPSAGL